ncbi:MAG TPA: hypothetical protein VF790_02020 [Dissulfurispiraceae bacterium]
MPGLEEGLVVNQWLLALAAILLLLALFLIYLRVKKYKIYLEGLGKELACRTEIVSTLRTRIFLLHGARNGLTFRCSYRPPLKKEPPEFAISFYGTFPEGLTIRRKHAGEQIEEGRKTGDADFDRLFLVREAKGRSSHAYLGDQPRRALIAKLLAPDNASIFFQGGSARAVFRNFEILEADSRTLEGYLDRMAGLAI